MPAVEIPILVSSDTDNGALNVSADGSSFTAVLAAPLIIPQGATSCTVELNQATVFYTTPNVSSALGNDTLAFTYDSGGGPVAYVTTLPNGLYSLSDLVFALSLDLVAKGLPAGLISFSPVASTQRVVMTLSVAGVQVDFGAANSVRTVLGFDAGLVPPGGASAALENYTGDNPAAFNSLSSYLVSCSLTTGNGVPVNGIGAQVIAQIPIQVSPGSVIAFSPQRPVRADCSGLIGHSRQDIRMRLLNQEFAPVDTFSEVWSAMLIIRYTI